MTFPALPPRPVPPHGAAAAKARGLALRRRLLTQVTAGTAGLALVTAVAVLAAGGVSGNDSLRVVDPPTPVASATPEATGAPTPEPSAAAGAAAAPVIKASASASPAPTAATVAPVTSAAPAADRTPLALGSVGTYSGVAGDANAPYRDALTAWAAETNRRGGLAGHPVRLTFADDQGDPATHATVVARLRRDGIQVLVGSSFSGSAAGVKGADDQLLVLGALPYAAEAYAGLVDFVPSQTTPAAVTFDALLAARRTGGVKVAVVRCLEVPEVCQREADRVVKGGYAAAAGLQVVYGDQPDQALSVTSPSYTSQCAAMRDAGADTLYLVLDDSSVLRLQASCRQLGFSPRYVLGASYSSPRPQVTGWQDGTSAVTPTLPWMLTSGAGAERARVLGAAGVQLGAAAAQGWVAGQLVERVGELAAAAQDRPGPLTRAQLRAAAATFRGETLRGLAPPMTGSTGAAVPTRCGWLVVFTGGRWTAPQGATPVCGSKP